MYYQEIISKLAANDDNELWFGDYVINKKLREVVGGISVYDIEVINLLDGSSEVFETLHDLDIHCLNNMKPQGLKRCMNCGKVTSNSYYYNYETASAFCSIDCLVKDMNAFYGIGNWTFASMLLEKPDLSKGMVLVKEDEESEFTSIVRDGVSWRYMDIQMIHDDKIVDPSWQDRAMEDIFDDQDFDS